MAEAAVEQSGSAAEPHEAVAGEVVQRAALAAHGRLLAQDGQTYFRSSLIPWPG